MSMRTPYYTAMSLDGFIATLGSGRPLLPRQIAHPPLRLVSVRQVGSGFAELRYDVPRSG